MLRLEWEWVKVIKKDREAAVASEDRGLPSGSTGQGSNAEKRDGELPVSVTVRRASIELEPVFENNARYAGSLPNMTVSDVAIEQQPLL